MKCSCEIKRWLCSAMIDNDVGIFLSCDAYRQIRTKWCDAKNRVQKFYLFFVSEIFPENILCSPKFESHLFYQIANKEFIRIVVKLKIFALKIRTKLISRKNIDMTWKSKHECLRDMFLSNTWCLHNKYNIRVRNQVASKVTRRTCKVEHAGVNTR